MKNLILLLIAILWSLASHAQVGVRYDNYEVINYYNSMKHDDFTYLIWDRNDDGDGYFSNEATPKFMYWDNDAETLGFLIDTQNMSQLKANFHSLLVTKDVIASGRLGIGTSSIKSQFTLQGIEDKTQADMEILGDDALIILGAGQSGPHGIQFGDVDNEGMQLVYRTTPNQLIVEKGNDGVEGTSLFSIDYDTEFGYFKGNVGIGVGTSAANLHVKGNPIDDPSFGNRQILGYFEQSASSSNEAGIAIKGAKNGSASIVSYVDLDIYDSNESTPDFTMARVGAGKESPDGINGQLRFYTNSNNALTEQMRIAANGSVGIGTTNPDAKLTVKGDIHAERVKVDLNIPAPDYVFEEDYDLRSLEETASYIQAHKHLPEVPSAKELESSGVDLVEMNMLLLKKIEELTLHVIELKKEHEAQQVRIQKLENQ